MKSIIISFILLIASSVFADTAITNVYDFCSLINRSSKKLECLEISKGRSFDSKALNFCSRYLSGTSNKLTCLAIIADKTYANEALLTCAKISGSSNRLECMTTTGVTTIPQPLCQEQDLEIAALERDLYRSQTVLSANLRKIQQAKNYAERSGNDAYRRNLIYAYEQAQQIIKILERRPRTRR